MTRAFAGAVPPTRNNPLGLSGPINATTGESGIVLLTLEMGIAVIVEAILSFVNLSISTDDPTWGGTSRQFFNEIEVAKYYTEVLNQANEDLQTIRSVLQAIE